MKRTLCSLLVVACVLLRAQGMHAQDDATFRKRLHKTSDDTILTTTDIKPWHLIASFQLFDRFGKLVEIGSFEEWWADSRLQKIVYKSPSYNNTEVVNKEGTYKADPALSSPEILRLLNFQIVHPVLSANSVDRDKSQFQLRKLGNSRLDCIMLTPTANKDASSGQYLTYCLNDKDSLLTTFNYQAIAIARISTGNFQGKTVAVDQVLEIYNLPAAKAHIEKLETFSPDASSFLPSADMTKTSESASQPSKIEGATLIKKTPPEYPESARARHIAGTVILQATIGTDGRIRLLRPFISPDPDLEKAAMRAVKEWVYKPTLSNGRAVETETTVTVNFSFSPR